MQMVRSEAVQVTAKPRFVGSIPTGASPATLIVSQTATTRVPCQPDNRRSGMLVTLAFVLGITATAVAQQQDSLPPHPRDRGRGVRISEFQTYIERHQLLLLPSAAYIRDHNLEYNPLDWGYGNQTDLRGTFRNSSAQLLIAYGVTEWLAVELEGSYLSARFERSARDTTTTPARIRESGLGDFAGQIRMRFAQERG